MDIENSCRKQIKNPNGFSGLPSFSIMEILINIPKMRERLA